MDNNINPMILDNARHERIVKAKKTVKRAAITLGVSLAAFATISVVLDRMGDDLPDGDLELNE